MSWKDKFPKEGRYYETKNGILYCGDCLEIMQEFPDKGIDLILTDPPYGIGASKGVGDYGVVNARKYEDDWDFVRPTQECFDMMISKSKNQIIFGGNYFYDLLPKGKHRWLFWDKKGNIKFKNPYSDGEIIWTSFEGNTVKKYKYIQQGFVNDENEKRYHPTQKPVKLLIDILKDFSVEGELILDNFAGSGSVLVASEKIGRKWIGIEINEKYCDVIKRRIEEVVKVRRLDEFMGGD